MNLGTIAMRGVTGAWILNSGINKTSMDEGTSNFVKGMAASGIPALANLTDAQFKKFISAGEITVGSALLLPFVSNKVAGVALGTFAAGLLTMYFRNESMTQEDGIRPSQDGTPLAKDMWLAAIAAGLFFSKK
jgi:uncharacterized membrane protein YphA (DoxX/SURF4 family)